MLLSRSKRFGVLHLNRTGGTWLNFVLDHYAPCEWELTQHGHPHAGADQAPDGFKLFGFIRNPWDWYVSQYFFFRQHWEDKTGGYLLPRAKWHDFEQDFAQMFERSPSGRDGFLQDAPTLIRGEFSHSQLTSTFNRIMSSSECAIRVGRFEQLRTQAVDLLTWACGEPLDPKLAFALENFPIQNSSRRGHYGDYYTSELSELVLERDRGLIHEFGYTF
jgi:hypothetical protein